MSHLRVSASRRGRAARRRSFLPLALAAAAAGCGTNNNYYETQYIYPSEGEAGRPSTTPEPVADAGAPPAAPPDAGEPGAGEPGADAGGPRPQDGLPLVDAEPGALQIDVLGGVGNRYHFIVSEEQLGRMNERYLGGGFPGGIYGDIYTPGGGGAAVTFVDRLLVSTPGDAPRTADFGKVQVKLVGESTGRPWTTESLPNFKLDADEFIEGQKIGGVKHLRLNNAVVGSIFREKLTLDFYRALGYPAPRASYAWVQSSVWGPEVKVPYVVVESYKPAFCSQREAELGGGCVNMWEFVGDLGYGQLGYAESCQFSECDPSRAMELELAVVEAPPGPGFKAALTEWLDWEAFHQFQCLSWILATGDDALHNTNNVVLMERADGKFQHLPYSVDISLGQEWYPQVPLAGFSLLANGCQSDPECWASTISTCEALLSRFVALDPLAMLEGTYELLEAQGMLRDGDEGRKRTLENYLTRRLEELPLELEENRDGPPAPQYCDFPFVPCGQACLLPEECFVCEPAPEPAPLAPDAGTGGGDEPLPQPPECLPYVELYDAAPGVVR